MVLNNYKTMNTSSTKSYIYEWYVVIICMLAYIFSFIDRQVLSLLVGPIKQDLGLTDLQFSLLHGLAFSIFYAVMEYQSLYCQIGFLDR